MIAEVCFCSQVTRTDANVLLSLDPEDLTVTNKLSYTSVLPEAKVNHPPCLSPLPMPLGPLASPCRQFACVNTKSAVLCKTEFLRQLHKKNHQ